MKFPPRCANIQLADVGYMTFFSWALLSLRRDVEDAFRRRKLRVMINNTIVHTHGYYCTLRGSRLISHNRPAVCSFLTNTELQRSPNLERKMTTRRRKATRKWPNLVTVSLHFSSLVNQCYCGGSFIGLPSSLQERVSPLLLRLTRDGPERSRFALVAMVCGASFFLFFRILLGQLAPASRHMLSE